MHDTIHEVMHDVLVMARAMDDKDFITSVDTAGRMLQAASQGKNMVFIAGNGGSWTDADHFAGELRAQFEVKGRPAVPSVAIPISLSSLTAWGNDYEDGFETAMTRDLEAMAKPGDVLIAISTSGKAKNIRRAMQWAKDHQMNVLAISGNGPMSSEFGELADNHIIIPADRTARIQEGYQIVVHMLCMYVDTIKE